MKFTFLFFAGLCFSVLSYAQTSRAIFYPKDTLKVNLMKENMSVTYKNQPVPVRSIEALDSFMKKIPDLQHLEITFETVNTKPETSHSIDVLLHKCNCHVTRKSISFRE